MLTIFETSAVVWEVAVYVNGGYVIQRLNYHLECRVQIGERYNCIHKLVKQVQACEVGWWPLHFPVSTNIVRTSLGRPVFHA